MDALLNSIGGGVWRAVDGVAARVEAACVAECPKRSGDTSRSFSRDMRIRPNRSMRARVYSDDPVVRYLEKGTGIFGPRGRRITPTTKKALRFELGGQVVFAKSVAGMRAQPFMKRSLEIGSPWPVRDGR